MKFNFKKIATVLGSALMVGSTMGLAAAANYPAPFVQSGAGDVAVVIGANSLDMAYATTITSDLSGKITVAAATASSDATGDSVQLKRGSDKYNLGDNLTAFYSTLDDEQLTTTLAKAVYLDSNNNEYDTEQSIAPAADIQLKFFQDSSFNNDEPIVGFDLTSGQHVLNYTLSFVDKVPYASLNNTDLKFLGKTWFVSKAESGSNGLKLTLLDSANTASITETDGTKVVPVGSKSYTVSIASLSGSASSPRVKLTVNGETTNSVAKGETYKLTDGTYVGIKDISMRDVAGTSSNVDFSIGSGKLVLENGQEVKLNDKVLSDSSDANGYSSQIVTYFTNTSTDISKMVFDWDLTDDAWIASGKELIMPGFNAIKLSMGGFFAPMEKKTTIDDRSDSARINTETTDGPLSISIVYQNDSKTGFAGLGEKSTHVLVTNATASPTFLLNESLNSYFVATWISGKEFETYAYEISSITSDSGKNATVLKNLATGGSDLSFTEVTDTKDRGDITFTLVAANKANKFATIKATATSGTVYGNLITTKEGMTIKLPVIDLVAAASDGTINTTAQPTSWKMNISEEDKDGNLYTSASPQKSFTVTLAPSTDGVETTATSLTKYDETDSSDWDVAMVQSDLATKLRMNLPTSGASYSEIYYAGEQSYATVYISEAAAAVGGSSVALQPVYDTAVSSVSSKNLIVIGGSCINSVAAKLLGSNTPMCGPSFTTASGVGAGQFIIKSYDAAAAGGTAGKVALLVAGYDAADTEKAATYLKERTVNTAIGSVVKKTSATYADIA